MKYCKYCGKEMHDSASFCPYCMNSLIKKQSEITKETKSERWLYFLMIGILILIIVAILFYFQADKKQSAVDSDESISLEPSDTVTSEFVETAPTSETTMLMTASTSYESTTTETTIQLTTTLTITTEPKQEEDDYCVGDYMTEGKVYGQIHGYGGYDDLGGRVLTIESLESDKITFSIVTYPGEDDTMNITQRNVTANIENGEADFIYDYIDNKYKISLLFENGKILLRVWDGIEKNTILFDEYLTYDDFGV